VGVLGITVEVGGAASVSVGGGGVPTSLPASQPPRGKDIRVRRTKNKRVTLFDVSSDEVMFPLLAKKLRRLCVYSCIISGFAYILTIIE
jgi:hypothetical protein